MRKETVREIDTEYYLIKIGSLYVGSNIVQNLESQNFGLNLTKKEKAYRFYKSADDKRFVLVVDALKELDIKDYELIYVEHVLETSTSVVTIDAEGNVVPVENPEEPVDDGSGDIDNGQDGSGETPMDTETPDKPVEGTPAPEEPIEEEPSNNG